MDSGRTVPIADYLNVEKLRDDLAKLDKKIEPLIEKRDQLRAFLRLYERHVEPTARRGRRPGGARPAAEPPAAAAAEPVEGDTPRLRFVKGEELDRALVDMAQAEGAPMRIADMLVGLKARGMTCAGYSARNTLNSHLHRSESFELAGRGQWALTEAAPLGSLPGGSAAGGDDSAGGEADTA